MRSFQKGHMMVRRRCGQSTLSKSDQFAIRDEQFQQVFHVDDAVAKEQTATN